MNIDEVSKNVIKLALYLNSKIPNSVSEIWIEESPIKELKSNLPSDNEISTLISETKHTIRELLDVRRRAYLTELVKSIEYQITNKGRKTKYSDFCESTFGYRIEKVPDEEIGAIDDEIQKLEIDLGKSRFDIFKEHSVSKEKSIDTFKKYISEVKSQLPSYIIDFPDEGFTVDVTTGKPWSAFNSHVAPFKSKMTLNSDIAFCQSYLYRLSSHEAYGGHHSELSMKDKLLVNQGRGEHGLVITFSPQTFISEAIAETMYIALKILDTKDKIKMLGWHYDRLVFALYNKATFMYFDDGLSKDEIDNQLKNYGIDDKTKKETLNFSTDDHFGRYAPVYYSGLNFLTEIFEKTKDKETLIKTLFTLPCTPSLLLKEQFLKD